MSDLTEGVLRDAYEQAMRAPVRIHPSREFPHVIHPQDRGNPEAVCLECFELVDASALGGGPTE